MSTSAAGIPRSWQKYVDALLALLKARIAAIGTASWHTIPFLLSGTFTATFTGTIFMTASGAGAGGAGGAGGTLAAGRGSGGGGGGGSPRLTLPTDVVKGVVYPIVFGVPGTGGAGGGPGVDGTDGTAGGNTTFNGTQLFFKGAGPGTGGKLGGDAGVAAGFGGPSNRATIVDNAAGFGSSVFLPLYQPPSYGGLSGVTPGANPGSASEEGIFAGGSTAASPDGISGGGGGAGGWGNGADAGAGGAALANGSNAPAPAAANTAGGGGGGGGGGSGANTTGGAGTAGGSPKAEIRFYA